MNRIKFPKKYKEQATLSEEVPSELNPNIGLKKSFKCDATDSTYSSSQCRMNIIDLRFFDMKSATTKLIVMVLNPNPDPQLMKMFNELEVTMIYSPCMNTQEYEAALNKSLQEELRALDILRSSSCINVIYYVRDVEIELMYSVFNFLTRKKDSDLSRVHHIFLTDESICVKLNEGLNNIYLPQSLFTKKGIGLLPISRSIVTTRGLRWDVKDYHTQFGSEDVSTSNELIDNEGQIYVHEGTLLFTAELNTNLINYL